MLIAFSKDNLWQLENLCKYRMCFIIFSIDKYPIENILFLHDKDHKLCRFFCFFMWWADFVLKRVTEILVDIFVHTSYSSHAQHIFENGFHGMCTCSFINNCSVELKTAFVYNVYERNAKQLKISSLRWLAKGW